MLLNVNFGIGFYILQWILHNSFAVKYDDVLINFRNAKKFTSCYACRFKALGRFNFHVIKKLLLSQYIVTIINSHLYVDGWYAYVHF